MKNKIVFGRWEAIMLTITGMLTQIFLGFPRTVAENAGTAGWLQVIYASILVLIVFAIIVKLYSNFPGKDLIDISEYIGGGILRIIVGCILLAYFLIIVSLILREYGECMKIIGLTVSPLSFVMLFFVVGMVVGAYFGLEAIARYGAIIVPLVIIGYLIIIFGVSQNYDFTNLMPLLGNGVNAVFIKGTMRISSFSALIVIFLIPPFIKTHRNFKIVGYTSIGIGAFLLISSSLVFLLVEPYPTATEDVLPVYQLARLINYGRFFQRIESLFVLIWASSAFLYLSMGFFFIVYIFKKTFKLEFYKPIIPAFAILLFSAGLIPDSLLKANELENNLFRRYAWIVAFLMTIILLYIGKIKKKNKKEGEIKGAL